MYHTLTIIICTYNPDTERLQSVVDAVANQVLPSATSVELLVIDNRSDPSIEDRNLNYGELAYRIIKEPVPRLTAARICGHNHNNSSVIVFVDDDNIIAPDYVQTVLNLTEQYPNIGVFSSGCILPEYLAEPPSEIETYWPYMALIDLPKLKWANFASAGVLPMGAGMAVRSEVMQGYVDAIELNPARAAIDRDGKNLFAGGDTDIGLIGFDMGYGCGYFPEMKLKHVMPEQRLQREYLEKLVRDVSYSTATVKCNAGVYTVDRVFVLRHFVRALLNSALRRGDSKKAKRVSAWGRFRAFYLYWKNN